MSEGDVVPLHKGESESPADILRDVMASAQAGQVSALVIVGLSNDGEIMTAWTGIDNDIFKLLGGLTYMQRKLSERVE